MGEIRIGTTWCLCSFHKLLIGGEPIDVEQIPDVIDANGDIVEIVNAVNGEQFMQALSQFNNFPVEFHDDLIYSNIDHGPVVDHLLKWSRTLRVQSPILIHRQTTVIWRKCSIID